MDPRHFFAMRGASFDVIGIQRAKTLVEKVKVLGATDVEVVGANNEPQAYALDIRVPASKAQAVLSIISLLAKEKAEVHEMRGMSGRHSRPIVILTASWFAEPSALASTRARYGNARRGDVTPETTVYSASAWWSESDPSMQAVALTAKRAETEIRKQMRESAKYARDEYGSISAAMDSIRWSGVHAFALRTLAKDREMEGAIADLRDNGVWYPETP